MGTLTYFSQGFEEDKWSKVCKHLAQCLTPGVSSVLTLCPCPLIKCYLCWFVSLLRGFPWSGTGVTGILLILGMCYIVWSHRPVPELPGKSTFFGSSDEFIEKRRQGLQHFLEKWVDLAGWHLPPGGDGRGVCAVQNGPGAYRHVCVRCFSCTRVPSALTQAGRPSEDGAGHGCCEARCFLFYLCLLQGPAECGPPVRQPVTPLPAKPALSAWNRSLCTRPKPHVCFWCHSSLCYVELWLGPGRETGLLSPG